MLELQTFSKKLQRQNNLSLTQQTLLLHTTKPQLVLEDVGELKKTTKFFGRFGRESQNNLDSQKDLPTEIAEEQKEEQPYFLKVKKVNINLKTDRETERADVPIEHTKEGIDRDKIEQLLEKISEYFSVEDLA